MSTFKSLGTAAAFFAGVVGANLPEKANLGNTAKAEIVNYAEQKLGLVKKNWPEFQAECRKDNVLVLAANGAGTMENMLKERNWLLSEDVFPTSFSSGMGIGKGEDFIAKAIHGNYKQICILTQRGVPADYVEMADELWHSLPGMKIVVLQGGIENAVVESEQSRENIENRG